MPSRLGSNAPRSAATFREALMMTNESAPIRDLVAQGVMDAPLAAHISILLDAGLPLTILATESHQRQRVADAFATPLRTGHSGAKRTEISVEGDHHFEWLSDPAGIGCMDPIAGTAPLGARSFFLRIPHLMSGLKSECARIALRSLVRGYQAIIEAQTSDLLSLFEVLRASPLRLPEDDLQQLGVVLSLDEHRLNAAHLLHPSVGTARKPPTLLTVWDAGLSRWDDFSWAALPVFAERSRMSQVQYDAVHQSRVRILDVRSTR